MTDIIDFLDKHDGSIMCFLTFGIVIFAAVTAYIANQKRADDLFKIRWEAYLEIIEIIRYIEKHYNHGTDLHKIFNSILTIQKDANSLQIPVYRTRSDVEEVFTTNHDFISRVRWLFHDKIADLVQNLIRYPINDEVNKITHYFEKKTINIRENGQTKEINFLIPTSEFTKLFDKYFKLDNSFLKRFFR